TKRQIAALRHTITSGASSAGTMPTLKDRIELESKLIELEDKIENEVRDMLLKVLGGFFLIIGAYFTWRQLTIAREGQITDRFTKAIGQLGDEKLAIRLGGIYALERIARDSERDHWPIMEVLTAYVRHHAPWDTKNEHQPLAEVDLPPV